MQDLKMYPSMAWNSPTMYRRLALNWLLPQPLVLRLMHLIKLHF